MPSGILKRDDIFQMLWTCFISRITIWPYICNWHQEFPQFWYLAKRRTLLVRNIFPDARWSTNLLPKSRSTGIVASRLIFYAYLWHPNVINCSIVLPIFTNQSADTVKCCLLRWFEWHLCCVGYYAIGYFLKVVVFT